MGGKKGSFLGVFLVFWGVRAGPINWGSYGGAQKGVKTPRGLGGIMGKCMGLGSILGGGGLLGWFLGCVFGGVFGVDFGGVVSGCFLGVQKHTYIACTNLGVLGRTSTIDRTT